MFDRAKFLDLLLSLHLNKGSRFQIGKWTVFLISPVHCQISLILRYRQLLTNLWHFISHHILSKGFYSLFEAPILHAITTLPIVRLGVVFPDFIGVSDLEEYAQEYTI